MVLSLQHNVVLYSENTDVENGKSSRGAAAGYITTIDGVRRRGSF